MIDKENKKKIQGFPHVQWLGTCFYCQGPWDWELKSNKPCHVAKKKKKKSPLTAPSLLHKNNYYHPICIYCL